MKVKVIKEDGFVLGGEEYLPYRMAQRNGESAPQFAEIADDNLAIWCISEGWCVPAEEITDTETLPAGRQRRGAKTEEVTE